MKMTSAYANKMIKKLNEDKEYFRAKENEGYFYDAAIDEEPYIPEYDYASVAAEITAIDEKVLKLKHAININNATNQVKVGEEYITIDAILVKMSQLNSRKLFLDMLRKHPEKQRINSGMYSTKKTAPEYRYINYDLELIKGEYERIDACIAAMQIELDKYNQTVEIEVDI